MLFEPHEAPFPALDGFCNRFDGRDTGLELGYVGVSLMNSLSVQTNERHQNQRHEPADPKCGTPSGDPAALAGDRFRHETDRHGRAALCGQCSAQRRQREGLNMLGAFGNEGPREIRRHAFVPDLVRQQTGGFFCAGPLRAHVHPVNAESVLGLAAVCGQGGAYFDPEFGNHARVGCIVGSRPVRQGHAPVVFDARAVHGDDFEPA